VIYELALVVKSDLREDDVTKVNKVVESALGKGVLLLSDDWGVRTLAWPTARGIKQGHYLYYIYENGDNAELARNFKIREEILKYMIIKLGTDKEKILNEYKTPFSTAHKGSAIDKLEEDIESDRKKLMKKRVCWLTAKSIVPNWKDPETYVWAINEFGKISPARMTSLTSKMQREITTTIKRAKQLGVASYMTHDVMK
jgi:small subunit ribosomal protein S18